MRDATDQPQETIGVARRAFPALLQFPNERIQFQIHGTEGGGDAASEEEMSRGLRVNFSIGMTGTRESSTSGMPEGEVQGHPYPQVEGWHNVLDEAWPYFEERPPEVIRVTVAPTQDEARTRECSTFVFVLLSPCCAFIWTGS